MRSQTQLYNKTKRATKNKQPDTPFEGLSASLLEWYDQNARILPWRTEPNKKNQRSDPYHVWLSEIMLQQTTVATVGPRYLEFLEKWPTIEDMARAPRDDILGAWAGLGYYARARNLHKCAQMIVYDNDGQFPQTAIELKALPGIGDYTAAAIASIVFDERVIVMDGNIERITARLVREKTPLPAAKPVLKEKLDKVWPQTRNGDFAQAMMDLGAQICRPKAPACELCPIAPHCLAKRAGDPEQYPVKAPKKKKPTRYGVAFVIQHTDGTIAFVRRPEKGLLGGMLGLPGNEWSEQGDKEMAQTKLASLAPLKERWRHGGVARHTFTHFHLELGIYSCRTSRKKTKEYIWLDPQNARLPTVMQKGLDMVLEDQGK